MLEKGVGPLRVSITVILRTAGLFRGCQDLSSGPKFLIMMSFLVLHVILMPCFAQFLYFNYGIILFLRNSTIAIFWAHHRITKGQVITQYLYYKGALDCKGWGWLINSMFLDILSLGRTEKAYLTLRASSLISAKVDYVTSASLPKEKTPQWRHIYQDANLASEKNHKEHSESAERRERTYYSSVTTYLVS